jgi:hypothetical protein
MLVRSGISPDQVLVLDHRRGAAPALPDAHPRSAQAVEAEPDGPRIAPRWELYTKAKEVMIARTHIPEARWWIVEADDKKRARLNCIHHSAQPASVRRDRRRAGVAAAAHSSPDYQRRELPDEMFVPDVY